jgi:hypothetical protein
MQVAIPVVPTVRVVITFTKFVPLTEPEGGHHFHQGHALDDGPLAGVRDERAHGRVPQHGGLRRPRHDEPGVGGGLGSVQEL